MRKIKRSSAFKKDFRRVKANSKYAKTIDKLLRTVLQLLCNNQPLPPSFQDHKLTGNWQGFRECHLGPDLLLIYRQKSDSLDGFIVQLARIGSHSELFG